MQYWNCMECWTLCQPWAVIEVMGMIMVLDSLDCWIWPNDVSWRAGSSLGDLASQAASPVQTLVVGLHVLLFGEVNVVDSTKTEMNVVILWKWTMLNSTVKCVACLLTGFVHECTSGSECPNWIGKNGHLWVGYHSTTHSGQHAAVARLQSRLQYLFCVFFIHWVLLHCTPVKWRSSISFLAAYVCVSVCLSSRHNNWVNSRWARAVNLSWLQSAYSRSLVLGGFDQ